MKLLALARQWSAGLSSGETDIANLARAEGVNDSWMSRVVRLNYLAPQIVDAILEGTQPTRLSATMIIGLELPLDWRDQINLLLAA